MNVKLEAKSALFAAGIALEQDFNSLNQAQLTAISEEASAAYERKHGKIMPDDSAAYIRKRYDLLQLRARGRRAMMPSSA